MLRNLYRSWFFQGTEFEYRDDWGEQLQKKNQPVMCILDWNDNHVSILDNIPDNISPGQVWTFLKQIYVEMHFAVKFGLILPSCIRRVTEVGVFIDFDFVF